MCHLLVMCVWLVLFLVGCDGLGPHADRALRSAVTASAAAEINRQEGATRVSSPDGGQTLSVVLPGQAEATIDFVFIEPGTFLMGSPSFFSNRFSPPATGMPQQEVTISQGFYLGKYELTQAQWTAVMETKPWLGEEFVQDNPAHPAVYISWDDMQVFIERLNEAAGADLYRLPTEAEWAYACRAGTKTRWSFGDNASQLSDYAWYYDNTWEVGLYWAQSVGTKLPNPWGLYDMHGNVYEWVQDWHRAYSSGAVTDTTGPSSDSYRFLRGGGFNSYVRNLGSANRYWGTTSKRNHFIGVRIVRTQ